MFRDTGARCRSHLLDDLLCVLVEELVHRLADHVVAVQLIDHPETGAAKTEIDQHPRHFQITNPIADLLRALDTGDRLDITCNSIIFSLSFFLFFSVPDFYRVFQSEFPNSKQALLWIPKFLWRRRFRLTSIFFSLLHRCGSI